MADHEFDLIGRAEVPIPWSADSLVVSAHGIDHTEVRVTTPDRNFIQVLPTAEGVSALLTWLLDKPCIDPHQREAVTSETSGSSTTNDAPVEYPTLGRIVDEMVGPNVYASYDRGGDEGTTITLSFPREASVADKTRAVEGLRVMLGLRV